MTDPINNPSHYQLPGGGQVIDRIREALGDEGFIGYLKGNVLKYVYRAGRKGDASEDLGKAIWYLTELRSTLDESGTLEDHVKSYLDPDCVYADEEGFFWVADCTDKNWDAWAGPARAAQERIISLDKQEPFGDGYTEQELRRETSNLISCLGNASEVFYTCASSARSRALENIPGADKIEISPLREIEVVGKVFPEEKPKWYLDADGGWRPGNELAGFLKVPETVVIDAIKSGSHTLRAGGYLAG